MKSEFVNGCELVDGRSLPFAKCSRLNENVRALVLPIENKRRDQNAGIWSCCPAFFEGVPEMTGRGMVRPG